MLRESLKQEIFQPIGRNPKMSGSLDKWINFAETNF